MILDDPPPSFLTPKQREYLRRDKDSGIAPGSADERAIRGRIRGRLRSALVDLDLVSMMLENRDRKKVLEDLKVDGVMVYYNILTSILPFLLAGLLDNETKTWHDTPEELFSEILERSLELAFPVHGLSIDGVDVQITIRSGPRLDEIPPSERSEQPLRILRQLRTAGEITSEEFTEIVREREDIEQVKDETDSSVVSYLVQREPEDGE